MMLVVRNVLLMGLLIRNDQGGERKSECGGGAWYQGLLKRVGASLEILETLEKQKF